ncbi:fibrous sheath CABYR-binding protein isoform X2 [Oryzias latipes]|uniref:fibrous sheath CABYR-binding protein isoform X2 n=1 Tax=Oryzias latipes TaxID=8090 RepID=UPI000CE20549|nr:fibrous sheath CABYR-binding protein isoform X2 [Oryzias latipes]
MGNEQSRDADVSTNGIAVEKHENGSANGLSAHIKLNGLETSVNAHRNGELKSLKPTAESGSHVAVQAGAKPADVEVASEAGDMTDGKKSKVKEKPQLLDKLFKKKAGRAAGEDQTNQTFNEDGVQSLTAPQKETVDLRQGPATGPQNGTPHPRPEVENPSSISPPAEEEGEDNPVMNFFKTLVTPTKTPKKETAAPDAAKDQVAQVSEPPAAPKGMPAPPPPPPEPPKAEAKGEAAVKPVKAKDEAKAAAKEPQSSKGKSATLSKLFRSKQMEEKPQPVVEVEKVDFSKAATLEAVAKPEPPPPAREEKKSSKPSFFSAFKPKVLLDHMTTKVQAASTSGVQLLRKTTGLAAEPKKTAASPPAAAEAALAVKAKEEPKPAAKSTEAAAENKPASTVSQAADDAAGVPKKLEKRNSIQLFFKNLGQKRHSTDAGVQTEPAAAAPAEKAK